MNRDQLSRAKRRPVPRLAIALGFALLAGATIGVNTPRDGSPGQGGAPAPARPAATPR